MRRTFTKTKFTIVCLFALGALINGAAPILDAKSTTSSRILPAFKQQVPKGISAAEWQKLIPGNNPMTAEKVALGEMLYFDKRLSADGTVSCATCHDPATAFSDHNQIATGVGGKVGTRNAPTILNVMFNEHQFWDGRASSLEEQVKQPLVNPAEMGMLSYEAVVARVSAISKYRRRFRRAFGGEGTTIETIAKAISAFERTQLSGNSPFDRFVAGDGGAMTEAQKRGWELFRGKAECINCHTFTPSSPFFTDYKFYNTGIATRGKDLDGLARQLDQVKGSHPGRDHVVNTLAHAGGFSDLGRYLVTRQAKDVGAFKTPTLRDVELTSPYMHDGSEKTLLDVVRFYNRGGERNTHLSDRIRPLHLTDAEMNALVEFMRSLTSDDVLRQVQNAKPQTREPIQLLLQRSR